MEKNFDQIALFTRSQAMELFHKGSVKDIYKSDKEGELIFSFSNRISVFDKPIPSEVPYKGEAINRCAAVWFDHCVDLCIPTHFIGVEGKNTMRVKAIDIERDYAKIPGRNNVLIPCEFILRHYVAGSFLDRLKKGKITDPELAKLNFADKLPEPYFETSTKVEPVDRMIDFDEAKRIAVLSDEDLGLIKNFTVRIDDELNRVAFDHGLVHVDGKKEFARNKDGKIMVIDVFGTPDEDRFWDLERFKKGEYVDLSKEHVRQHYRDTGYKDELYAARAAGKPEPEIPPMPEKLIKETSELYIDLFERLTGEKF